MFVKYVHLIVQGSNIYDKSFIDMINTFSYFNKDDHLFFITKKMLINDKSLNIINLPKFSTKNINKALKEHEFNFIFLHSNIFRLRDVFLLKKKYIRKIVWCTWGHDLYRFSKSKNNIVFFARSIFKSIYLKIYDYSLRNIVGVGIGFQQDKHMVLKRFGSKMEIYDTPYFPYNFDVSLLNQNHKFTDCLKIMVGHSGYEFVNHIDILRKISKYKDENVTVSIVLAYGNYDYIQKVILFAKNIFNNKVEIIDNIMNMKEYVEYLKSVDIAIFDHKHQSALSNIFILLHLMKKVFLNAESIIAKELEENNVLFGYTDQIDSIDFQKFICPINTLNNQIYAEKQLNPKLLSLRWKNTFDKLDRIIGS